MGILIVVGKNIKSAARFLAGLGLCSALSVQGAVVTFIPADPAPINRAGIPVDAWKNNPSSLVGRTIVSTSLFIDNILNWQIESDDVLYIRLLNDTKYSGINAYAEMEATGDYFGDGPGGISLVTYKDLLTYATASLANADITRIHNISESQIAALMSYAGDGAFVMSIDPDCRFFGGDDMDLIINVAPPTPPAEVEEGGEEGG